jgi:hypothetical protein
MEHTSQQPPLADGDQKRERYIGTRGFGDDIMVSSYSPLLSLVTKLPLSEHLPGLPVCLACASSRRRVTIRLAI